MGANDTRNWLMTPHSSQCRVCHFSGYSNLCDYHSTGKCPMVIAAKDLNKIL